MIRTMTYRDLTPERRAQAARKTREKLLGLLNNPFLTVEQRKAVYDKIGLVGRWEKLQLDAPAVQTAPAALQAAPQPIGALPAHTPQHHDVAVKETVPAGDKVS